MHVVLYCMSVYRHMSVEVKGCAPYFLLIWHLLILGVMGRVRHTMVHMDFRGQLGRVCFHIQQYGFWGLNSGHKTYPKVPLTCCVIPATL